MKTSRIYHELNLDIVTTESGDVCYVLLPEKMKEAEEYKKHPEWVRQFYELRLNESL